MTVLLIAVVGGALVAAAIATALRHSSLGWRRGRRVAAAAGALPAAILLAAFAGVIWAWLTLPEHGEGNRDLVTFVVVLIGAVFALATLVGGLVGAALVELGKRS